MARVNIEDSFWSDDSYQLLVENVGANLAAGMCLRFMRLAQRHWVKDELVPLEVFQRNGWEPLLDSGFALLKDEGVYCRGSEQNFDWLVQCAENGRKGGVKSSKNRKPKKTDTSEQANASDPQANVSERKPLTLTPTLKEYIPSTFDSEITEKWIAQIYRVGFPDAKPPNPKTCHDTFRLLREKDGLTETQIRDMLAFVTVDSFWSENAYSPAGLRKDSKNGLKKWQNIFSAMKARPQARQQPARTNYDTTQEQYDDL